MPPNFEADHGRTELVTGETEAQLVAYDDAGDVIGTIALWVESDGRLVPTSDYADGYAETIVIEGRARTEATLPPAVVAIRADAMLERLDLEGRDPASGSGAASRVAATGTNL